MTTIPTLEQAHETCCGVKLVEGIPTTPNKWSNEKLMNTKLQPAIQWMLLFLFVSFSCFTMFTYLTEGCYI